MFGCCTGAAGNLECLDCVQINFIDRSSGEVEVSVLKTRDHQWVVGSHTSRGATQMWTARTGHRPSCITR